MRTNNNAWVRGRALGVLVAATLLMGEMSLRASAADNLAAQLAEAQDALNKAQLQEKEAYDARYSLDMARAATEAIVTAARETKARGEKLLEEAQEFLRQVVEEAKIVGDDTMALYLLRAS